VNDHSYNPPFVCILTLLALCFLIFALVSKQINKKNYVECETFSAQHNNRVKGLIEHISLVSQYQCILFYLNLFYVSMPHFTALFY